MPETDILAIRRLYACFNVHGIDDVLVLLADDVARANGMEGGHMHGHQALRDYWTRQWAIVSPHVEPVAFAEIEDKAVAVEVIQTIRDSEGKPLHGQTHGLKDKTVTHCLSPSEWQDRAFRFGEPA